MSASDGAAESAGRLLGVLLALLLAPALLLWLWSATAGLLFGTGWPHLDGRSLARALLALPEHLANPRSAWPPSARRGLPDAAGFYGALALLAAVLGMLAAAAVRLPGRRGGGARGGRSAEQHHARWASPVDLRALRERRRRGRGRRRAREDAADAGGRLALGYAGRRLLRAEQRHALVVFGPPQSGKSAGLAAGALLEWEGPAIASSIKTDLLAATIARRRAIGRAFVFDPFLLSGLPGDGWSPLHGAGSFDGALESAHRIAAAGELDQRSVEGGDFWTIAAEQRLAPLLYAAANSGRGVDALIRWAYGQGEHELREVLEELLRNAADEQQRRDAQAAYDAAAGFQGQPERTRGSIEGTVQALLRAYRFTRVQRSARSCEITPQRLLNGPNTLYLVGDAKASRLLRPIFLALLGELIDHAYEQANRSGGRLARALLLCLDELGNVAPLPNLAEIASTAPSHNIQLVSVFHDLAQARARYGRQAETVINSHRARMLLPGVADLDTLRYFSNLLGEQLVNEHSRSRGPGGQTRTESRTRRPLAPAELLRQLPDGNALLLYGRLPPTTLRLRMWFNDPTLRALANRGP